MIEINVITKSYGFTSLQSLNNLNHTYNKIFSKIVKVVGDGNGSPQLDFYLFFNL